MMRARMVWSGMALLFLVLVCISGVQAYKNQQSWLDGSLSPDSAMKLLEQETDRPIHSQQQQQHEFDAPPIALMEVAAMTSTKAKTQTGAQMRTAHGWVNGPPRRRTNMRRQSTLSQERAQLRVQAQQDKQYAENLKRFAQRRDHFSVPKSIPSMLARNHQQSLLATAEESQVESLIQLTEQKPVVLHHVNNVHAKLTADKLYGRGMSLAANRRTTARALANSPRNRPQAPSFVPLPVAPSVHAVKQAPEVSFVQTKSSRPFVVGPPTAKLPPRAAPVARAAPRPVARAPAVPAEHEFVAGLPQAFMELDPATQLHILALADQELQLDAKKEAQRKTALISTQERAGKTNAAKAKTTKAEELVNERDLAAAADALHTLSEIHAATHTPWSKLLKALAGKKQ